MRHQGIRVDMTERDWRRVERLRETLRLYGYDAAANNALEICQTLGASSTDRLMEEFGARLQLSRLLCEDRSGRNSKTNTLPSRTSQAHPSVSSRRDSPDARNRRAASVRVT